MRPGGETGRMKSVPVISEIDSALRRLPRKVTGSKPDLRLRRATYFVT